jgi:hypothetical protein
MINLRLKSKYLNYLSTYLKMKKLFLTRYKREYGLERLNNDLAIYLKD